MYAQKKLENKEGYHWESRLLKDLGFIKMNLRQDFNGQFSTKVIGK